jgi:hypothetical protein
VAALAFVAFGGWMAYVRSAGQPVGPTLGEDCGTVENSASRYDVGPPACLWAAYLAAKQAHATLTNYTIEGDPISYSLAIRSSDRIDVLVGSRDRYSPMGTFAYACTGLVRDTANAEPGRFHLIATACAGPTAFLDGTRLTIP